MATTYNDTQIAIVDSSGNISVIYPRTKAGLVSLTATSYNDVESCLAALGTAAFKNTSNTYNATGTTVATTKAVYDAYTNLNNKISNPSFAVQTASKVSGSASGWSIFPYYCVVDVSYPSGRNILMSSIIEVGNDGTESGTSNNAGVMMGTIGYSGAAIKSILVYSTGNQTIRIRIAYAYN